MSTNPDPAASCATCKHWGKEPESQTFNVRRCHAAFGAFIRKKREEKQIQMNEFARQLEISPAYWSRIERDMEKPPKDELIRKAAEEKGYERASILDRYRSAPSLLDLTDQQRNEILAKLRAAIPNPNARRQSA